MDSFEVIIVGGGHGGAQAAIALRSQGFLGSVAILSAESEPPYERPPLSKSYLSGAVSMQDLYIRPKSFWDEQQIHMILNTMVVKVDAVEKKVTTRRGQTIGYKHLIWAAGGEARRLSCPGGDLQNVLTIRNHDDIDRLQNQLSEIKHVVVIGGGFIGLESAAVLVKLGKQVTLLEALPRVLARVSGPELSKFFEARHRENGVDLRTSTQIQCIEGVDGRVSGVRLTDGEFLSCESVIVGIGIVPSGVVLQAAGAELGNGVLVDMHCKTNLPDVYAIGDCAAHRNPFAPHNEFIRLESVQNAVDMANCAVASIMDRPIPYESLPRFWSDQYDLKMQTQGLSIGYDSTCVRGNCNEGKFSVVYLRDKKVIAVDCVNFPKDFAQARKLILSEAKPDLEALADSNIQLKEIID